MPERRATFQVEPESELDRVDARVSADALPSRPKRLAPARVLKIIGLGESSEESNVARHKDRYLADAADHRGA